MRNYKNKSLSTTVSLTPVIANAVRCVAMTKEIDLGALKKGLPKTAAPIYKKEIV